MSAELLDPEDVSPPIPGDLDDLEESHETDPSASDSPLITRSPTPPIANLDRPRRPPVYYATLPIWKPTYKSQFISSRGNEYFCEVDEEYLTDRFNLTGLNTEVPYYQYALDLVTDVFDLDADDDLREQIEKSARHLYGLVHARYIVTTRGLAKMVDKYKKGDFGKCPRVMCEGHPLLPMGQHDIPNLSTVRLYCAKCEDIYNPKSSRHAAIDGAYFGTSFHSMLFQVYPALAPEKSVRRYEPRIYGFRVHAAAALARWQDQYRDDMKTRLRDNGIDVKYAEESEEDDEEDDEEDEQIYDTKGDKTAGDAASARMELGR
ncbi:casein kinase 2 regulatory subunit [Aspergillus nanangensis]|uniref:Casein kinase II subunit beta n=1 Tax=Aspergillus nanangensis TaxID=2582783 RepID=A0AAD4CJR6_ASPNN|nr:casein kinase 2 regulatory subunit [Aspergillus nanangensis]